MKEVKTSLFPFVGKLDVPTPDKCAVVEYRDKLKPGSGPGFKKFWAEIEERLNTRSIWFGYDRNVNEEACIEAVGIGNCVIKIIHFDKKIENEWSTLISHIVMANGKVVKWDGKTEAKKWIVECYLMALSDQLICLSAKNAKLLGYTESGVNSEHS